MQDTGAVVKYGYKSVFLCAILLLLAVIFDFFVPVFVVIFLLCIFLFRNPERVATSDDDYAVFSPIDGNIQSIQKVGFLDDEYVAITINNKILNTGVLRAPCDICLIDFKQKHGLFLSDKNLLNERVLFVCKGKNNAKIIIQVIAGICSRSLNFSHSKTLKAGRRFGFIIDGLVVLMLPTSTRISVSVGDKVKAFEVLGFLDYEVKNDK